MFEDVPPYRQEAKDIFKYPTIKIRIIYISAEAKMLFLVRPKRTLLNALCTQNRASIYKCSHPTKIS